MKDIIKKNLIVLILAPALYNAQTGPGGVGNSTSNRLWLKADAEVYNDAGTTIATNGNTVQQWNDVSGNGNHASQASSGNRPTYTTNIVNALPALDFSGSDYIDPSALGIPGTGGFSIFIALQPTSINTNQYIIDRTSATNNLTSLKYASGNRFAVQKRTDSGSGLGGPESTTAANTSAFQLIDYMRTRGTAYDFYLDGTLEGTLADGDGDLTPPSLRIGTHATNITRGLNGYISEVAIYNTDLNEAERIIVENYFAAKYALTISNDKYSYDATHENDVAGIGMENVSEFHDDAQSAGILEVNTPSTLATNDYLLFGHDDGDIATWTTTEAPNSGTNINRLAREWRFNETGDVGTIKFTIDTTLLPARTVNYTKYVLMVDSDGDFSNGAAVYEMESPGTNNLFETASNIDIADGDYVAIGEIVPTIEFTLASSSGFEPSSASLEVGLNYISKNGTSVTYNTADGTATSASPDYTAVVGGTLTVSAGSQTNNIIIAINNDVLSETDEDFTVTISGPPAGISLGTNTVHTYTINDDDNLRKIYFTAASSSGAESVSPVTLTVSVDLLQIDNTNPTTVDYTVTGGTATGGGTDYTLATGTATIAATTQTTTFNITINDDAAYELSETIIIDLSNPTNSNLSSTNPIQYTYTITDNDTPPVLEFGSASSSGDESVTTVNLPVNLSFVSGITSSATYTISGSSTASGGGTDYTLANGTVTIPALSTTTNITATIIDDADTELPETIILTLSAPSNCTLGTSTHTYTITDNDEFGYTGPGGVGDLDNNKLWLKADESVYSDAGSTLAATTNTVQQWNDVSGNGNNASQASSTNRPTYTTNVVNSLPALDFSGSDYMDPSALGIAGTGGFSIFIALQPTSINTNQYIIDRTSGTNNLTSLKYASGNRFAVQKRTDSGSGLGGPESTTAANTSAFQLIDYMRTRGTAYDFYLDGTLEGTLADGDGDLTPPSLRIGTHATNITRGLNGYISEVAIYDTDLNEAQRKIVENYLAAKYALTIDASSDKFDYDATYGFEVAGIGRENTTEFHADAQGSGIVRIQNPSSLDIGDYLLWGHDNDTITKSNDVDSPIAEGVEQRMDRDWRATHNGDVGTVDISFDLTGIGTVTVSDLRLLIDKTNNGFADETVAAGTIISGATDLGSNIYQFTGITISDSWRFTLGTINAIQTPLPIELISFNAEAINNDYIQLDWTTASETNNDYFTIEKSTDGTNWEIQSEIDGAGKNSSVLNYQSFDLNPYNGTSYYRLKQTDFDGRFSYSESKTVNIDPLNNEPIRIYPNPTDNIITIEGNETELSEISIYNILGADVTAITKQIHNDSSV